MKIQNKEIYDILKSFLVNVEESPLSMEDATVIIGQKLNLLALCYDSIDFKYDDTEYPDSPEFDYQFHYNKIKRNFPYFGFYNTVADISVNLNKTTIVIGDSIDDITDILIEIKTVLWLWDNTSVQNALWQFKTLYDLHWGSHLKNLQVYLFEFEQGR